MSSLLSLSVWKYGPIVLIDKHNNNNNNKFNNKRPFREKITVITLAAKKKIELLIILKNQWTVRDNVIVFNGS